MGLFTGLLTLPLAPLRGVVWVAEQVADETERRYYDEGAIRAELLELEFQAADDSLTPEEIRTREDALLTRLALSQARGQPTSPALPVTDREARHPNA
jgi:gas vesicle protein GvpG